MMISNDFSAFVDNQFDISDEFSFGGKNDVGEGLADIYRHVQLGKADFDDREYRFDA